LQLLGYGDGSMNKVAVWTLKAIKTRKRDGKKIWLFRRDIVGGDAPPEYYIFEFGKRFVLDYLPRADSDALLELRKFIGDL